MAEPRLWSINALAVELERDRRTLAKRLSGTAPAGQIDARTPGYRLSDVVKALTGAAQESRFDAARARKAEADARLAELAAAKACGTVVEIEAVAEIVGAELSTVRSRLLAMPAKLAPRLAAAGDARACQALVAEEVDAALTELSEGAAVAEKASGRPTPKREKAGRPRKGT